MKVKLVLISFCAFEEAGAANSALNGMRMRKAVARWWLLDPSSNAPGWRRTKSFFRNNSHEHEASLCTFQASDSDPDCTEPKTIDAGSSNRKPISLWPGMYHSPATHALWEARSTLFEKPVSSQSQSQFAGVAKTPSQSRTSISYNFSSDYILREQYRNPWNRIRMGKLVEDLDALAGTIAFKVT